MSRSAALLMLAVLATVLGAACRRTTDVPKADAPSLNVTNWTEKTELYMEYPPLVAGRTALFAVHLTTLADFQPLAAGRPRLEFIPDSGGAATLVHGSEPSRPGAFRVEGAAPPAGRYRWSLVIEAPGLADRHELGLITVHADEQSANADAEKRSGDDPSAIAYLKEQR